MSPFMRQVSTTIFFTTAFCGVPGAVLAQDIGQRFERVGDTLGITHTQSEHSFNDIIEPRDMTGGAAAADFDGDGWTDLYFSRHERSSDDGLRPAQNVLYRNVAAEDGGRTFENVTDQYSTLSSDAMRSNGVAWGDIDNDHDPDLYVMGFNNSGRLYENQVSEGNGFTSVTSQRNIDLERGQMQPGRIRKNMSPAFGDYDRDGYLDLFTTEWFSSGGQGTQTNNRLFRNQGETAPGYFTDVTQAAGIKRSVDDDLHSGFSPRFTDLDNDGHPDLVSAGDWQSSRVFWNNGDGTFTDGTDSVGPAPDIDEGVAPPGAGQALEDATNAMGSTVGDFDGDGRLDWFITSTTDHRLLKKQGDRTLVDVRADANVFQGTWGWGATFLDHDNDRDLDLIFTNGIDTGEETSGGDPTKLLENQGDGTFEDATTEVGINHTDIGTGLLKLDYDKDGDLDVVIVENGSHQPTVLENKGGDNNWLQVDPIGTESNADGINARLILTQTEGGEKLVREIDGGSNFLSQDEMIAHFGLGDFEESIHELRIEWSSAGSEQTIQTFSDIDPNQRLIVNESTGIVPEPSSFAVLVLGGLSLLAQRRLRPSEA